MDQHHGLAAQSRGGRLAHPEGQCGSHCGVDGVSACFQHRYARRCGTGVGSGHHALLRAGNPLGLDGVQGEVLGVGHLASTRRNAASSVTPFRGRIQLDRSWARNSVSTKVRSIRLIRSMFSFGVPRP